MANEATTKANTIKAGTGNKPGGDAPQQAGMPMSEALERSRAHTSGEKVADKQPDTGGKAAEGKTDTTGKEPGDKVETPKDSTTTTGNASGGATATGGKATDAGKGTTGGKGSTAGKGSTPKGGKPKETPAPVTPQQEGEVLRGGTKQVKIIERVLLSRGGLNTNREDPYPFDTIGVSRKEKDGTVVGPSFFIPEDDNPAQKVATARKRYRGSDTVFYTRKHAEEIEGREAEGKIKGLLIWRGTKAMGIK